MHERKGFTTSVAVPGKNAAILEIAGAFSKPSAVFEIEILIDHGGGQALRRRIEEDAAQMAQFFLNPVTLQLVMANRGVELGLGQIVNGLGQ